ncbi:hypothetical protein MRX96_034921 [Rhipicephalus microplus]
MASTQMADNGGQPDVDWTAETFKKKRVKLQSTKKKGCTATMHIKKVEVFPDFEIAVQGCTKNRITMLKSAALTNLSQQLNGDNPPSSNSDDIVRMDHVREIGLAAVRCSTLVPGRMKLV